MNLDKKNNNPIIIGRFNLIFNSYYNGSLVNFQLEEKQKNFYDSGYNKNTFELSMLRNFFKDNQHLHLRGYYGINQNLYLVSKLINSGPILYVYHPVSSNTDSEVFDNLNAVVRVFHKNNLNNRIGIILRDENHQKDLSFCNGLSEEFYKVLGNRFLGLHSCGFSYSRKFQDNKEFYDITKSIIRNYFEDYPEEFVSFITENDISFLSKVTKLIRQEKDVVIYSRSFLEKLEGAPNDIDRFMDKLTRLGSFYKIPGKNFNNLYFLNNSFENTFQQILINIFDKTGSSKYHRKKSNTGKCSYEHNVITLSDVEKTIPKAFREQLPNPTRFLIRLIKELKLGRILKDQDFYIRRYKYGSFKRITNRGIDFIYT